MEHLLKLYKKPYDPKEPVICADEKSKQLLAHTRTGLPLKEGKPARVDYEYKRKGTRNLFVAVEPKGGYRNVQVTKRRTKQDFAWFVYRLLTGHYRLAKKLHLVLDNLNTHFKESFIVTFGEKKATELLKRIEFHYTPKHASWLNMAEIEINVLSSQALKQRIPTEEQMTAVVKAWQSGRNRRHEKIVWKFTVKDARKKFKYEPYNPTKLN
jgi:hypothetical protein